MGAIMNIVQDVERLIREVAPNALCNDCIADELGLSVRQQAYDKTKELGRHVAFDQGMHTCVRCGDVKLVTRYALDP
jgi:hypothetical protein